MHRFLFGHGLCRYIFVGIVAGFLIFVIVMLFSTDKQANYEYIEYIKSFGLEVSDDSVRIVHITVPNSFDEVYETYNNIISTDGFDLYKFAGEPAVRYTYSVASYGQKNADASIVVCHDQIVAAYVCIVAPDGRRITCPISSAAQYITDDY